MTVLPMPLGRWHGLEGASAVNETVGLLVLSHVHPDSDAFVVQAKSSVVDEPGTDSIVQVGPCLTKLTMLPLVSLKKPATVPWSLIAVAVALVAAGGLIGVKTLVTRFQM